ncbi:unnamed protein product, partial [Didymodactylos carnosus]
VLKLYAWESAFIRRVLNIRENELIYMRQKAIIGTSSTTLWSFIPILVCIVTFATYILSSPQNVLTADKAFVSLALFNLLRTPLIVFPNVINSVVEARVSNERIKKFLSNDEIDGDAVQKGQIREDETVIKIDHGSFQWASSEHKSLILKRLLFTLVALIGTVGSGKSSILSALLGEMTKVQGQVTVGGRMAYVPQQAWIMNSTLQQNILFGKDLDREQYDLIIEACALKQDLDMLLHGDQTEIGEKGINLSGGQKQRVSLARAIYNDADIYLLDDPLSAVDAHVGEHIFKKVIGRKGLLSGK